MSDYKYKAFISYSHADEKWVKWLHKRLESYRIPRYLVKRDGLESNRLKPIFRDRDELSSSSSLSGAIGDALAASENLIVICSPQAAQSKWVNEEIKAFKEMGRGDRIHCLIVSGDPTTAFPPALLTEDEPLAADVQRDNRLMSFLKVAAGILQVPFDDLRQREQHARNRRLAAVAGFSFAGMVLAVGLATFALISRQQAVAAREEAETQRQVAEAAELVAVREAETSTRVSDFLVGLFQVSDPSEARGNSITARELLDIGADEIRVELADQPEIQATLNHTIGSVYHSLGLYEPAREQLELGLSTRREVLGEAEPAVAATLLQLAELERSTGNLEQSRELYREALAIREAAFEPDDLYVAEALNELASLYWDTGDLEDSRQLYERALRIRRQKLGENHPDVAITLRGLGAIEFSQRDLEGVTEYWVPALDIFRASLGVDHPDTIGATSNLAIIYYLQDRFEESLVLNREVVEARDRVFGPDHPGNVIALNNLAETLVALGRYQEALPIYNRSIRVGEEGVGEDYIVLGLPLTGMGILYGEQADYDTARSYFERALRLRENAYGADSNHTEIAETLIGYSAMLEKAGELDEAEALSSRARAILEYNSSAASLP